MIAFSAGERFLERSKVSQGIQRALTEGGNWEHLDDQSREALQLIAHDLGSLMAGEVEARTVWGNVSNVARILCGDQGYPEHPTIKRRALMAGGWVWHVGGHACPCPTEGAEVLTDDGSSYQMHRNDVSWGTSCYWRTIARTPSSIASGLSIPKDSPLDKEIRASREAKQEGTAMPPADAVPLDFVEQIHVENSEPARKPIDLGEGHLPRDFAKSYEKPSEPPLIVITNLKDEAKDARDLDAAARPEKPVRQLRAKKEAVIKPAAKKVVVAPAGPPITFGPSAAPAVVSLLAGTDFTPDPTGKPKWSDAPHWAVCMSQNSKGVWKFWSKVPSIRGSDWVGPSASIFHEFNSGDVVGRWQDTLEYAPGYTKS